METLKKARDFDRVFRRGRSVASQELVMYALKRNRPGLRIAFCVSRKLGGAVVRNRLRRRLREVFRSHSLKLTPKWDLILLARQGATSASFVRLDGAFLELAGRLGIMVGVDAA